VAQVIGVPGSFVRAEDVPDADVTFASFWNTAYWIADWPESKGLKAYFVQHYETHSWDPDKVRATYRMPYLKVVNSRWVQKKIREDSGDLDVPLIRYGVDWPLYETAPRGKAEVPTVGMLYSRNKWKGSSTAFAALKIVQEKLPELRVVAFGADAIDPSDGPPANLEFHLRPEQSEIPRLCRKCDCWLVASTTEGFGMPGLEAAACRCPVVSTRCGGPEDYVGEGRNGHLVTVGDPHEMAAAILRVLSLNDDEWKQMSDASYQIARGFDWDRSAELLERLLGEALASHRHAG
jgi:glycosyltransferase involved in cell wall biosynthesis